MDSSCVVSHPFPFLPRENAENVTAHGVLRASTALNNSVAAIGQLQGSMSPYCGEIIHGFVPGVDACYNEIICDNAQDLCPTRFDRYAKEKLGPLQPSQHEEDGVHARYNEIVCDNAQELCLKRFDRFAKKQLPPLQPSSHEEDLVWNGRSCTHLFRSSETTCMKEMANGAELLEMPESVCDKHVQENVVETFATRHQSNLYHDFVKLTTLDPSYASLSIADVIASRKDKEGQVKCTSNAKLVPSVKEAQESLIDAAKEFGVQLPASKAETQSESAVRQDHLNSKQSFDDFICSYDKLGKEFNSAGGKLLSKELQERNCTKLSSSKPWKEDPVELNLKKNSRVWCSILDNKWTLGVVESTTHTEAFVSIRKSQVWWCMHGQMIVDMHIAGVLCC